MNETTFTDLRCREVINLCDGARLGFVSDLVLDLDCGRITALVVPGRNCGVMALIGRGEDCVIPWECVEKIGEDIIFVRWQPSACTREAPRKRFCV